MGVSKGRTRLLPNGRSAGTGRPFALIRCADLATTTIRNLARDHPDAFRLWLYVNALWRPGRHVVLSARATMKTLHMRSETFAKATRKLLELNLMTRTREASMPGKAAGAAGLAAEYDIPTRSKGAFIPRSMGDPEPKGVLLADARRLCGLAADLTPAAAYVWLVAAGQPRDGKKRGSAWGTLSSPFTFKAATLATDLNLARSTIYDALAVLRDLGEAEFVTTDDGRSEIRPAGTLLMGRNARNAPNRRGQVHNAARP